MASGGFGGGVPHQDYPLPLARPPGIIFSIVNRHYNKYDLLRQIPLDIRAIRRYGSFYVTFSIGQYSLVTKMSCPSLKST